MDQQTMPQSSRLPKASAIFRESFGIYKQNIILIGVIFAIPLLLNLLQPLKIITTNKSIWSLVTALVTYIAAITLFYSLTKREVVKTDIIGAYNEALPYLLPALWIGFLVVLATVGGLVLLVVPGIFVIFLLNFSVYSFFVDDKRGLNALVQSWYSIRGSIVQVFSKFFFLMLILIALFVALVIISIPFSQTVINAVSGKPEFAFSPYSLVLFQLLSTMFSTPIGMIFSLVVYKKLLETKGQVTDEVAGSIRKKVKILIAIGIVVAVILALAIIFIR